MVEMTLDNVYLKITGMEKEDELALWNLLSFQIQIFGPVPDIRYRHLYNRKTHLTYAGLFPYAIGFFKKNNIKYKVYDNRLKPEQNANFKFVNYLEDGTKVELRPYQKNIVDKCAGRAVIQAATGAGKSIIMAALIARFSVKSVCIFAHTVTLCRQLQAEIGKFLNEHVGLVGDGVEDYQDITVVSMQSADDDYIRNVKMILFDECHHIPANTCVDIANKCVNAYYRIGVSATPWRDAGDDMLIEAVLSPRIKSMDISASTLIKMGYLVQPTIYFVPITTVVQGKKFNDIYQKAIVDNDYRNRIIYQIITQMHKRDRKILVLIKNIQHGETILNALKKLIPEEQNPITVAHPKSGKETTVIVRNVEFLSGNDGSLKRSAVIEAVKQDKCHILIASVIADEGLDLPILDTLVLAGGGKSSTRAFQRIGRVIRLYKNKKKAVVFDFMDYTPMLRNHSRKRKRLYSQEPEWIIREFAVQPLDM